MHSLLSISSLLSESWTQFKRDGRYTRRIAVWFLLLLAVGFVSGILRVPITIGTIVVGQGGAIILLKILSFCIALATVLANLVIMILVVLRLYQFMLSRDHHAAESTHLPPWPWKLFWSTVWIMLLIVLISLACLLGGGITFGILYAIFKALGASQMLSLWIPGIIGGVSYLVVNTYFGINFSQSLLLFLEDGKRGTGALAASKQLVKGHWWATFWRLFVPGLLYCLFLFACYAILILVGLIIVFATIGSFTLGQAANHLPSLSLGAGIGLVIFGLIWLLLLTVVPYLIQIFVYPSLLTIHVKLFHALKSSR